MADAGEEAVFADKDNDVDWDLLDGIKQEGTVAKLQQAAKNQDQEQFETLSTEVEKHYRAICGFRVNKDDARSADVDKLSFLFEFTQTLLEVKSNALKLEEEALKKAKDKNKKQREQIKEYMDRIDEQDKDIQGYLDQLQQSVTTPAKGKGGEGMRSEAEYKGLQKQLEATKEQLSTVQRDIQDEKARAKELLEKERKAHAEKDKMQQELEERDAELERMQIQLQENTKREQNARKKSQTVQKEAYKFVKEVSELNEKASAAPCFALFVLVRDDGTAYALHMLSHRRLSAAVKCSTA
jgi:chromosome segregation ATPase